MLYYIILYIYIYIPFEGYYKWYQYLNVIKYFDYKYFIECQLLSNVCCDFFLCFCNSIFPFTIVICLCSNSLYSNLFLFAYSHVSFSFVIMFYVYVLVQLLLFVQGYVTQIDVVVVGQDKIVAIKNRICSYMSIFVGNCFQL